MDRKESHKREVSKKRQKEILAIIDMKGLRRSDHIYMINQMLMYSDKGLVILVFDLLRSTFKKRCENG